MSKYATLSARFAGHPGPEWRASFAEIEEVLGFPLPKSARAHPAWWANERAPHQPHKKAWSDHGWAVEHLDQAAETVRFRKAAAQPPAAVPAMVKETPVATDEPAILQRLDASPGLGMAIVAGGVALAVGLGALVLRGVLRRRSE